MNSGQINRQRRKSQNLIANMKRIKLSRYKMNELTRMESVGKLQSGRSKVHNTYMKQQEKRRYSFQKDESLTQTTKAVAGVSLDHWIEALARFLQEAGEYDSAKEVLSTELSIVERIQIARSMSILLHRKDAQTILNLQLEAKTEKEENEKLTNHMRLLQEKVEQQKEQHTAQNMENNNKVNMEVLLLTETVRGLQESLHRANATIDELEAEREHIQNRLVQDQCIQINMGPVGCAFSSDNPHNTPISRTEENLNTNFNEISDDPTGIVAETLTVSVTEETHENHESQRSERSDRSELERLRDIDGLYDRIEELQNVSRKLIDGMGEMRVEREIILVKRKQVNSEMVKLKNKIECFQEDLVQQSTYSTRELVPFTNAESRGIQTVPLQFYREVSTVESQNVQNDYRVASLQNESDESQTHIGKLQVHRTFHREVATVEMYSPQQFIHQNQELVTLHNKFNESVEARESEVAGLQIQIGELQRIIKQIINETEAKNPKMESHKESKNVPVLPRPCAIEQLVEFLSEYTDEHTISIDTKHRSVRSPLSSETMFLKPLQSPVSVNENEDIKMEWFQQEYKEMLKQVKQKRHR